MFTFEFSGARSCSAICFRTFFAFVSRMELPLLKVTPSSLTFSLISSTGQPLLSTEPASSGHLSTPWHWFLNTSSIPFSVTQEAHTLSLSISGSSVGQPPVTAGPGSAGHLSMPLQIFFKCSCIFFSETQESHTPSESGSGFSSGQPSLSAGPYSFGHLSRPLHFLTVESVEFSKK